VRSGFYAKGGKRFLDICIASLLLIVAAPVIAVMVLFSLLTLGRPIFFVQERAGLSGRVFRLFKFRSMLDLHDAAGKPIADEFRLPRYGRLLRRSSLDELPELINILKGEMSLVGPRPLLVRYLPRYTAEQMRRHEIPPGLTGWAEVHGRNALSWKERFQLDVWYVDHLSFSLDVRILIMTVWKVLTGEGLSEAGCVTKSEFLGSEEFEKSVV
jgi:lipopolysaccharide/colanic/teichoic acid biosynthesis glycosyltransferase